MWYPSISSLIDPLSRLSQDGGAQVSSDLAEWLSRNGIAIAHPGCGDWIVPCESFLASALPASDDRSLCRKAALRVPFYRLHLDLLFARVLHAIGQGERWSRFEDLVFGPCHPIMPRIYSLLVWVGRNRGKEVSLLSSEDWSAFERSQAEFSTAPFADWDVFLWGRSRKDSELFPLLENLYLPIVAGENPLPSYFVEDPRFQGIESRLVKAARDGDAISLSQGEIGRCEDLLAEGMPINLRPESRIAWLTGAVCVRSQNGLQAEIAGSCEAPEGISTLAKSSQITHADQERSFVCEQTDSRLLLRGTFVSFPPDTSSWPEESASNAPPWGSLPGRTQLRDIGKPRKLSAGVDGSLLGIASHPLYGVLLQILLAEALDRELGEPTILIAPPLDRQSDCIEGETSIYYRPASREPGAALDTAASMVCLGFIDPVLDRLAIELDYRLIRLPRPSECPGVWSFGLRLFISAGFVTGFDDRWTISSALHDRLYGGFLMKEVLRDRKELRAEIHKTLTSIWEFKGGKQLQREEVAV